VFPIYVCYDSGVSLAEQAAIEQGLLETRPVFGCQIINYGAGTWEFGRLKSANEVVRSLPRNERGQINATQILDSITEVAKSWVDPGAVVMLTSADLCAGDLSWCFGIARPSTRVTVQSLARYRWLDEAEASACIRRTLRHELGHIFCCAADARRSNTVEKLGMHCTNLGCSMQQTMSLNELRIAVRKENPRQCFCAQCMDDLRRFRLWQENNEKRVVAPTRRRL